MCLVVNSTAIGDWSQMVSSQARINAVVYIRSIIERSSGGFKNRLAMDYPQKATGASAR